MKEKKCKKCERVLPLGEFNKNKTKKDGLQGECKKCVAEYQRKYNEANKDKLAEKKCKYREANKDKIAEKKRKYREANKDKIAEKSRKYYEANKDKIAESQRKYNEANKDKLAERGRKYREANKEKVAEYQRKYREANKDKLAEKKRKYREANKDKLAEKKRKYREANKDKIAEGKRKHYEANKDKIAESQRKWQQANKEKVAESHRKWRKRLKNDPGYRAICEIRRMAGRIEKGNKRSLEIYGVPSREWATKIRRGRIRIYDKYFKGVKKHLDHIRPLAEVKHSVEEMHKRSHFTNFVYIPAEVNMSKGAKPFWEWFAGLKDEKLKKCIAEQDEYNKKIQRQFDANT